MGGWSDAYYPERFCTELVAEFAALKTHWWRHTVTAEQIERFVDLMVKYIDAAEDDLSNFIPKMSKALQFDYCHFIIPCRAGFRAAEVTGGEIWNEQCPLVFRISNDGVLYAGQEFGENYFKPFRQRTQDLMVRFFRTLAMRIEIGNQEGWPW